MSTKYGIAMMPFVLIVAVIQCVPTISSAYPGLSRVLSLGSCGALLLIWACALGWCPMARRGKAVGSWWRALWAHLSMHAKRQEISPTVPVARLSPLCEQVVQLRLTLRAAHLLRQDIPLHGEFEALMGSLTQCGFPDLERVCLEEREFAFFLRWARALEARVQQAQTRFQYQEVQTRLAVCETQRLHRSIGETYPAALSDSGYLRLQGAVKLLEKIWQDEGFAEELVLVHHCAKKLQRDMEALIVELQRNPA
jgi:hypothetical protein